VVDLAVGEQGMYVLEKIHVPPSNRNSVTFAVVDSAAEQDSKSRPSFIFTKPLTDNCCRTAQAIFGVGGWGYGLQYLIGVSQ
jgi:hypothetical protein